MYYAVHKGFNKGIFDSWDKCKESINGYSNAIFKKCITRAEAEYFLEHGKENKKKYVKLDNFFKKDIIQNNKSSENIFTQQTSKNYQKLDQFVTYVKDSDDDEIDVPIKKNNEPFYVYTDGSCIHNGKPNAKAGIGVYFSEIDPRNVSRTFTGKQSNNTAELLAIIDVTIILKKEIENKDKIVICTDSKYSIRCCTTYGAKLESKGWTEKKPNIELVKKAYNIFKNIPNVTFKHIKAHTGKQDRHSIGNDGADRLANMAIGLHNCPYNDNKPKINKSKKIYLKVSYNQKEDAKKLGAKWDFRKKKWYIFDNNKNKDDIIEKYSL